MGTVYLVRHCAAEGQAPDAVLTAEGREQAQMLAGLLADLGVERIVASPFARAVHTVAPLAERLGLPIETDERLRERVLAGEPRADWLECLRAAFADPTLTFPGGESGLEVMARGKAALADLLAHPARVTVAVAHGGITTAILQGIDSNVGFDQWQGMTTPDVFRVHTAGGALSYERVWSEHTR